MLSALEYGFYKVDLDYLEYLHSVDPEVYYSPTYHSNIKPFIGVIVGIEDYNYFIPLSSAKPKHKKWKNVSDEHILIYEIIDNSINIYGDIYKKYSDDKKIHVISILDIKKMIPVPEGFYEKIVFKELEDEKYQDLFRKEYSFCLKIKDKVLKKVKKIYNKQKETNIIKHAHCNFSLLEEAMEKWIKAVNLIP